MWARRQVAPPTASGGTSRFLLPQEHTRSYGEEGTGQTPEGGPCRRPARPAVRLPGKSEVKDSHPRSARRWLHCSEAEGLRVPQTLSRMRVFRASARAPQGGQEGATRGTAGPEKGRRLWGAWGPRPGCRLTCDAPGGGGPGRAPRSREGCSPCCSCLGAPSQTLGLSNCPLSPGQAQRPEGGGAAPHSARGAPGPPLAAYRQLDGAPGREAPSLRFAVGLGV